MLINKFRNFQGEKIDDVVGYVQDFIGTNPTCEIYVGADSQNYNTKTNYAVAICMYIRGRGAHIIYAKETLPVVPNLFNRLWGEVERTILIASELRKHIGCPVDTHFDVNPNEIHRSNIVYRAAVGYAQGAGFPFKVKPYSFAASVAADKLC